MKAAFLAFHQCPVWQVALLQMFLHNSGWTIRTLTFGGKDVITDSGLVLKAQGSIETTWPRDYDLVLLPGGELASQTVHNPHLHRFLRQFDGHPGIVAALSSGVALIAAAGLLGGMRFATDASVVEQYEQYFSQAAWDEQDACLDGNIITGKGQAHYDVMLLVCKWFGIADDPTFEATARRLGKNM